MTDTLVDAALNPRLRPRDVRLLVLLHHELDSEDFRPLKQLWAARLLGVARPNISKSLSRLIAEGYLEKAHHGPGPLHYRLLGCSVSTRSQAA
jgi:DNA-binding MarR family transcriptional regulator